MDNEQLFFRQAMCIAFDRTRPRAERYQALFDLIRKSAFVDKVGAEKCWLEAWKSLESWTKADFRKFLKAAAGRVFDDPTTKAPPPLLGMRHTVAFLRELARYVNEELGKEFENDDPPLLRIFRITTASGLMSLFHIDHILPEKHDGRDALSNFNLLPLTWNTSLGAALPGEGRKERLLGVGWCALCVRLR